MILTNYHTHSDFCDGTGSPEAYVDAAIRKGFTALGFSAHAPIPVENEWTLSKERLPAYLAEIERLQSERSDRIQIYKALEIDFIPGSQAPDDKKYDSLNLDYRVGSVHSTADLDRNPLYHCVDGPLEGLHWLLDEIHGGSFENLSAEYYSRVAAMVRRGGFAFLGHLDLIKKRNRNGDYFSEDAPWYRRQVRDVLDVIDGSGVFLELNSGAIARGALSEFYPSPWILAEAKTRGIPVVINADAHRPDDIDCHFAEMRSALKEIGYRENWALLDGDWTAVPL